MFTSGGVSKAKITLLPGLIALAGFFVLGANAAQATTTLSFSNDTFPNGYTLTTANSPYLVQSTTIKVAAGTTVTIEPGVVIKMKTGLAFPVQFIVDGTLIANGTAEAPVVITSYKDDAYGGDMNADGANTSPARGNWHRMSLSQATSRIELHHIIIRYGGKASGAMIELRSGATAIIEDSMIEQSLGAGMALDSLPSITNLTLTRSTVRNNALHGVGISNRSRAAITGSIFTNNERGVAIDPTTDQANLIISGNSFFNNAHFGLDYDDTELLTANNNWWGNSSGPTHTSNPSGTGERARGNISLSPWTTQDPANQPPVLSYVSTDGYISDGVEPNTTFKNSTLPVFKVLYADAENAVSYVRLVTASSTVAMATSTGGVYEYTPASDTFGKGTYTYHFEASDGVNTVRLPALGGSGELSFEVKNIPVILVPGIMGTEMWNESVKVWPDIIGMIGDPGDDFMNILAMNFDGTPQNNQVTPGDIVRKPAIANDVFDGLIARFTDLGYLENIDLFVAPYDWRLDMRDVSDILKIQVNLVKNQTGSNKVDIVAHSMGGLATKQYILDNSSGAVNKLVFIGTPHLGTPLATKTLLWGDDLSIKLVGVPFLDPERVRYISQNMISLYELLPSRAYFEQNGRYYFDETSQVLFDFDQTTQFLTDSGLSPILLQTADNLHSNSLDNFNVSGMDVYNINGCDIATITDIIKRGQDEYSLRMMAGDGTVAIGSSRAIDLENSRQYYFKDHGILNSLFPRISHSTMPSTDGIRELITNIITGSNISLPDYATQNVSECHLEGEMVSVHSPVNLHIYDSDGNHVGRGENGDIDYNISGVAYEEIGENKFVFLPTSGGQTYQIELDGTGVGTYSLRVSRIEDNEVVETAYYSDLPVNTSTEATVTLADSVSNTVLQVDQNGTGSFTTAPVSAVLDSAEAADVTQPSSTITVAGGQTQATVSLSATDDNAGVLKTEYSLNNGATWQTYSSSFIITTIGDTTLQYYATDRAGNVESTKSRTITVTAAPNAVISIPSSSSQQPTSQVLGEQVERTQYTKEEVLDALSQAKTETLLDYLNKEPNPGLEKKITQDYGQGLALDQPAINFITYGTKSTDKLGIGERVNVLRSYQYAFGKLPQTPADWQDAVNMATGQLPVKRNTKVEQEARAIARKVYGKVDDKAVMMIAYGLRPAVRDINKEQTGLSRFGKIFGRLPSSVFDWNIFRKLVY